MKRKGRKKYTAAIAMAAALIAAAGTGTAVGQMLGRSTASQSTADVWEDIPADETSSTDSTYSVTTLGTSEDTTDTTDTTDTADTTTVTAAASDISTVVEQAMPSVVSITNTIRYAQYGYAQFGSGQEQTAETAASGSGVIVKIDDDAVYIVTNHHVIEDASELSIEFADGSSADAAIVGDDSTDDIALIKVSTSDLSSDTLASIQAITFADSDSVKIGSTAIAIGNALGYGQSVTTGIVSALDRTIQESETETMEGLIQTDAAINPGNSGGALLDANGNLIGINVAKYSDTDVEGMGYAIPSNTVLQVVKEMLSGTYVSDTSQSDTTGTQTTMQNQQGMQAAPSM